MAAARARESARADPLFHDPLAAALAGPEGFAWLDRMKLAAGSDAPELYPVLRTRFFDDFLLGACSASELNQVVLVAAGLDTRAFRLHWPRGTCLYELDLPEVLDAKQSIVENAGVESHCERRVIRTDLNQDEWPEALLAAGFQPHIRSIWLIEGLLFYLPEDAVHTLLARVSAHAAAGSMLGLDLINLEWFFSPPAWPQQFALNQEGAPGRFGTDHPELLLNRHGWAAQVKRPGEPGANYRRWSRPPMSRWLPFVPQSFLVTASRS